MAAVSRLAERLLGAPAGTVATVVAGAGYGKSGLLAEFRSRSSLPSAAVDVPAGGTPTLADLLVAALGDLLGRQTRPTTPPDAAPTGADGVRDLNGRLVDASFLLTIDGLERLQHPQDVQALRALLATRPEGAVIVLAGRCLPTSDAVPARALLRLTQDDLTLTRDEVSAAFGPAGQRTSRAYAYVGGWPAGASVGASIARAQPGLSDVALRRGVRRAVTSLLAEALAPLEARQGEMLAVLCALAPINEDDWEALTGAEGVDLLECLRRRPMVGVTVADGVWSVLPVVADHLSLHTAVRQGEHDALIRRRAHLLADAGRIDEAMSCARKLADRPTAARLISTWAIDEALRGFPEAAGSALVGFTPADFHTSPELLVAESVICIATADMGGLGTWLQLLGSLTSPDAAPWSATDPRIHALLAETAGLAPVGGATRESLAGPGMWAGLAHITLGQYDLCHGRLDQAEALLRSARPFTAGSLLLGGSRVALLAVAAVKQGRADEASQILERAAASLEASKFADERITYLLDAVLARANAHDGDASEAARLVRRSLRKAAEVRSGGFSLRFLAALMQAEAALAIGDIELTHAALAAADQVQPRASEYHYLVDQVARLRRRVGDRRATQRLTAAQQRVLEQLATPYPVNRLAATLELSPATVRAHIQSIYRALDVSSRGEAVDRARVLGLL